MSSPALAATLLLSLFDPSGDTNGDGTYRLPPFLTQEERSSLDLRSLEAFSQSGKLLLKVGFSSLANPLGSSSGFSVPYLDVFIKTDVGGQTTLGDTGFKTPLNSGWQYHLVLTGFSQRLESQLKGATQPSSVPGTNWKVSTEGSKLVIATNLPAGKYAYWVLSSLFDPLTPKGYTEPSAQDGPYDLYASLPQSPHPVDVLLEGDQKAAYKRRVLEELGEVVDRRPIILLLVGALGLVLALWGTVKVWRR